VPAWTFGFLLPIRLFKDRIASFGCTVLDRMTSDISRLSAISSRLDSVALAICSSRALLELANQPAMTEEAWRRTARFGYEDVWLQTTGFAGSVSLTNEARRYVHSSGLW
jgi:hypothetical protein